MWALYRAEMHSQAHKKTNNYLKTKHYKIGIILPQIIYEFSNTGMIVIAKNKDTTPCLGPRMLSILSLTCYNRRTKKIPISHLIYPDFARVWQVWKSHPNNGSGNIHYLRTNARHGGRSSVWWQIVPLRTPKRPPALPPDKTPLYATHRVGLAKWSENPPASAPTPPAISVSKNSFRVL